MPEPKILVVDDEKTVVEIHKKLLEKRGYHVIVAYNGAEALTKVASEEPDLVLTDVSMPEMDGLQLCERLKGTKTTRLIPIIMLTAMDDFDNKIRGIETGADDFLAKPVRPRELYARVQSLLRIKNLTDNLESAETVIFSLANAIEAKDVFTKGHTDRVSSLARRIGEYIGMSETETENLEKGGILHDIGKIGIRDTILNKPGKLTDEEFEEIKKHPETGEKICRPLRSLEPVLPIIKCHHERFDGSGYPLGLAGEQIPLPARIVALVDVYEALRSKRAYRDAMPHAEAMAILLRETAESKFDPEVLKKFEEMMNFEPELRQTFGKLRKKPHTPVFP
ncbi:MAG: response regulator [Candidatus Abyssobacteria bacterium SURF_5]|uniref:Response regulator n=1 Tax=Abyssobacteria bacterium (strain SURF_5) TaxID=2093360 RepID=A0A3A4P2C3_ABYX5|nr:MAG: response regulator [Candidatus Abyssubacteria bacterium SURF_5]